MDNILVSWSFVVSYAGAEKGDEGMALKIRTKAKDMPDKKTLGIMPTQNGIDPLIKTRAE